MDGAMLSITVTVALALETLPLTSVTVKVTGTALLVVVSMVALNVIAPRSPPSQLATANTISLLPSTKRLDALTEVILSNAWKPTPPVTFGPVEFNTTRLWIASVKFAPSKLRSSATETPLMNICSALSAEASSVALMPANDVRLNVFL